MPQTIAVVGWTRNSAMGPLTSRESPKISNRFPAIGRTQRVRQRSSSSVSPSPSSTCNTAEARTGNCRKPNTENITSKAPTLPRITVPGTLNSAYTSSTPSTSSTTAILGLVSRLRKRSRAGRGINSSLAPCRCRTRTAPVASLPTKRRFVASITAAGRTPSATTATGTVEARISATIARVEVSSPPGELIASTTSEACRCAASARPRWMYPAETGCKVSCRVSTTTGPACEWDHAAVHSMKRISRGNHRFFTECSAHATATHVECPEPPSLPAPASTPCSQNPPRPPGCSSPGPAERAPGKLPHWDPP